MDRPCDLLIVIAKATFTRNCFLVNLKGIFDVVSCKVIFGMNVVSPTWFLINICASITQFFRCVTMSSEPLHNPCFETILYIKFTGVSVCLFGQFSGTARTFFFLMGFVFCVS